MLIFVFVYSLRKFHFDFTFVTYLSKRKYYVKLHCKKRFNTGRIRRRDRCIHEADRGRSGAGRRRVLQGARPRGDGSGHPTDGRLRRLRQRLPRCRQEVIPSARVGLALFCFAARWRWLSKLKFSCLVLDWG